MEQDSDHEVLNLSLAPPNPDAAETPPLGPNLPVAPSSSSSADSNVSQGLSSCTNLPVAPSSSTDGLDLSLGLSVGSAAAGSPYLGTDISPAITSGSQVASSAQDLPKPPGAINFPMTKITIELRIPPKFFEECDPGVLAHWQKISHFTEDHPSNFCRRHALYFDPDVLKTNYNNIVADSFWARRTVEVPFPSLPDSLHFDDGDANLAVGDNSQNASANQSLVPQVIPPFQQMNVPSPDPQVGPNLRGI